MRGNQAGVQLDGALERRERVRLAPTHRERHAEIHVQPGVIWERLKQLAIDPRRFVEPAGLHGPGCRTAARGEVGRLSRCRKNEERKQDGESHRVFV